MYFSKQGLYTWRCFLGDLAATRAVFTQQLLHRSSFTGALTHKFFQEFYKSVHTSSLLGDLLVSQNF